MIEKKSFFVLGSGSIIPVADRFSAAYAGVIGDYTFMMDTGSGSLRRLAATEIAWDGLDAVFYTHLHPDHTADLVPLLFALKYPELKRSKPLTIYGPEGFLGFYNGLRNVYGSWIIPDDFEVHVEEIGEVEREFSGFRLKTLHMLHGTTVLGYRIEAEGGRSLVFSGDTHYCENIVTLAKGADVVILECSFPDELACDGHLSPSSAGRIATESGCSELILSHLYPVSDQTDIISQVQKVYQGPCKKAFDLMEIELTE